MRIAIIGAGISGLSCAHELELLGVKFDIFEKKYKIGDVFPSVTASINLINRPLKKTVRFVEKMFDIRLTYLSPISNITMKSQSNSVVIKGNLGHSFLRGQDENSLENQLYSIIKTKVQFDTYADIAKLRKEYDKVVVATGDQKISMELGIWDDWGPTFGVKQVKVLGKFEPSSTMFWLNTNYAKTGYVYLIPFDESSACIGLVAPGVVKDELDILWDNFINGENINYEVVETYSAEYQVGVAKPLSIDNIYIVGNAGGFTEPLIGRGQIMAIWSGVLAARSIVSGFDYNDEVQKVLANVRNNIKIRRAVDKMDNNDFDKIVAVLGMPVIKNIIYNTNIDILKHISYFL